MNKKWLYFWLIIQPILDIVASVFKGKLASIPGYLRLVVFVGLSCYVFYSRYRNKISKKEIILFMILVLYSLLHLICLYTQHFHLIFGIAYYVRCVQIIVYVYILYYLIQEGMDITFILCAAFYIIALSILIAHITGTDRYTYFVEKVGTKGWFSNANTHGMIISGLAPCAIAYSWRKQKWFLILTIVTTWLVLATNGTRTALYLSYLLYPLFSVYILWYSLWKKKYKIVIIGVFCLILPFTPRIMGISDVRQTFEQRKQEIIRRQKKNKTKKVITVEIDDSEEVDLSPEYYIEFLDKTFGKEVRNEFFAKGVDSPRLDDNRYKKRIVTSQFFKQLKPWQRFFGLSISRVQFPYQLDIENDYHAIYYYYGYIGFGLYMLWLLYFVGIYLHTLWKKRLWSNLEYLAIGFSSLYLVVLAHFTGALLRRPNATIYLSLLLYGILVWKNKKEKNFEQQILF